ncbi:MAG: hemolysin (HlyC) family protein [Rhodospirillaceae bacterium]|jgi:magnesium and cobalt transporter|nr:hemolysin (HlyC) family protein [Rhodospirillaceae bacterium]
MSDPGNGELPPPRRLRNWLKLIRKDRKREEALRDALEQIIEEAEAEGESTTNEEPITAGERILLGNIFRLRDLSAQDIMVPRADILAVPEDISQEELLAEFRRHGHSRLPVYRESLDDVIGFVHIKDLLAPRIDGKAFDLKSILRQVLFVAPSMRVLDLLLQMRLSRQHLALVVDEFGGIDGLITIEDLVEQIVGEIEDEHDIAEGPKLLPRPDGTLVADARATIEEFEERVGPVLTPEEREADIDTLGGLVFNLAGRVPSRGELVAHPSGLAFEVVDADPRRVRRLRVRNLPTRTESPHD